MIQDAINDNQNQYVAIIIQDKTLEELCKVYIDNNHPILIWATMRMTKSKEGNSWYLTKVSENSPTSISGEMNRFFYFITVFLLKIGIICYNIYATNIKRIEL